jgi:hypothetical protein
MRREQDDSGAGTLARSISRQQTDIMRQALVRNQWGAARESLPP